MNKPVHTVDPPRYPAVIHPLELGMKTHFEAVIKKTIIDITKQLVKEVKQQ
jgi:hypothetical protein